MAGSKTLAIWTAADAILAGNITEDAAWYRFLNRRLALVFPEGGGEDYWAFFRGILPQYYTGGQIWVDLFCTTEDDGPPSHDAIWWGGLQRHNLNDPIDTLSYGTEVGEYIISSLSNYLLRIAERFDFDTAAKRDNVAAGDMFTLYVRRDGSHAADTLVDTAYLLALHMYESFF